jgi:hypothetical protein
VNRSSNRALAALTCLALIAAAPLFGSNAAVADDAAAAAAADAATASEAAKGSAGFLDGMLAELGPAVADTLVSSGFDLLLGLAFPGPNYQQELTAIQSSITAGFAQTNAELTTIQASINQLSSQVSSNVAVSAQGDCLTVIGQANTEVAIIQQAYNNYLTASTPAWVNANLVGQSGTNVLNTFGRQVFGSGPGIPPFLPGLNSVAQSTSNLASLLNQTASGQAAAGLIATCADAVAARVAASGANASTPGSLAAGSLEDSYFIQMQQLTSYYASWANIGTGLSVQGGILASMLVAPTPPATFQQAELFCANAPAAPATAGLNLLSCAGVRSFASSVDVQLDKAWMSTGAGWGQTTGGTIRTGLRLNPSTGFFSGGSTPWLVDVAEYAKGSIYQPRSSSALTTSGALLAGTPQGVNLAGASPSGQAGLNTPTWGGLSFQPASSDQWDALLGLESASFYPGAMTSGSFADCLPNANDEAISCVDPSGQLANRMAQAGLLNASNPVGPGLIFYTGESWSWNPAQSSYPAMIAYYDNDTFPVGVPSAQVATFLDTSALMVAGRSAVINNPNPQSGDLTVADMYPFALNTNGIGNTIQSPVTTIFALSQSASSSDRQSTGVQCAQSSYPNGITGQTLLQFLGGSSATFSNGSSSTRTVYPVPNGSSAKLYCQNNGWSPPGSTNGLPVLSTSNPQFYAQPQLYLAYAPNSQSGDQSLGMGMYACSSLLNPSQVRGNPCPSNPWQITAPNGGTQPGWMVAAGSGASVAPMPQYGWPVVNTAAPQCNPGNVTQGSQGNAGIPQVCAQYLEPFMAAAFGVDFGPLAASVAPTIGQGKNTSVTLSVLNLSSSSQTASLGAVMSANPGATSGTVTPQTGGQVTSSTTLGGASTNISCTLKGSRVTCPSVTFAPGTTYIAIPVSGQRGIVNTFLDGNQVYASAIGAVAPGPNPQTLPPDLVTGVRAVSAGSNQATVSWEVPVSPTPIVSYRISYRQPNGSTGSLVVPVAQVSTVAASGSSGPTIASYTAALPQAGFWSVSVAATNANGTGPAGTTSLILGSGPPPSVTGLQARELPNGRVLLNWTPIVASPPLDSYVITAISPAGQVTSLDVTTIAVFTTEPLTSTGIWTFSVAARNSVGTSNPTTVRLNVLGSVPGSVEALNVSVSPLGAIDTSWLAPIKAVPPPTSYVATVYAPGGSTPTAVASVTVPASGLNSMVSVPALYQLGRNSPAGVWTVVVQATNASGAGVSAKSSILVTPNLLNSLGRETSLVQFLQTVPAKLQEIEAFECAAGVATPVMITGTCTNGKFTPRS